MTDLASLVVKLEAETSQYTAAIKKAAEDIGSLGDKVGESLKVIRDEFLAFETAKKAFEFGDKIVESMGSLHELSQTLGMTTESLSALQYAAKLEGIKDIQEPLEHMARAAASAEQGNTKLQLTFSALGVSIKDLETLTPEQIFDKIADATAKYGNNLDKTNAIQQIFGRGSAQMIALLNEGSKGLDEAKEEATIFGQVVSEQGAKAAHEFEQDLVRIQAVIEGGFKKAFADLLPIFDDVTKAIVDFAKSGDTFDQFVQQVETGLKLIATTAVSIGAAFEVVGKYIGGTIAVMEKMNELPSRSDFFLHPIDSAKKFSEVSHEAQAISKEAFSDIGSVVSTATAAFDKIWDDQKKKADDTKKAVDDKKPTFHLPDMKGLEGADSAILQLDSLQKTLEQQVATFGMGKAAAEVYSIALGKIGEEIAKISSLSGGQQEQALQLLVSQHKLSAEAAEELGRRLKETGDIGDAYKTKLIGLSLELQGFRDVDAFSKLDQDVLKATGHLQEAAAAADALKNRQLRVDVQTQQDFSMLRNMDATEKAATVQATLNTLREQYGKIIGGQGSQLEALAAADKASGATEIRTQSDLIALREENARQLDEIVGKMQAMAAASGDQKMIDAADRFKNALANMQLQNGDTVLRIFDQLVQKSEAFAKAQDDAKKALAEVDVAFSKLRDAQAHGQATDLQAMQQEDDLRRQQLQVLQDEYDRLKEIADEEKKNEIVDPKQQEALLQLKKQMYDLDAEIGQLAKTLRDDFVNDATSAFDDFVTHTKTAKQAFFEFTMDIERQLLQLVTKDLFQKLFQTTIGQQLTDLFGGASGALGAGAKAAGGTAQAAQVGTAIESAFTAGSTATATAITTAFTAGSTEAATAIEAAMASGSAMGGGGGVGGIAGLFSDLGTSGGSVAEAAAVAAASGGQLAAEQKTLVGEVGPEVFVEDMPSLPAASATLSGTRLPEDLSTAHIIGAQGPEYIKPEVSGFVIPAATFAAEMQKSIASPQAAEIDTPAEEFVSQVRALPRTGVEDQHVTSPTESVPSQGIEPPAEKVFTGQSVVVISGQPPASSVAVEQTVEKEGSSQAVSQRSVAQELASQLSNSAVSEQPAEKEAGSQPTITAIVEQSAEKGPATQVAPVPAPIAQPLASSLVEEPSTKEPVSQLSTAQPVSKEATSQPAASVASVEQLTTGIELTQQLASSVGSAQPATAQLSVEHEPDRSPGQLSLESSDQDGTTTIAEQPADKAVVAQLTSTAIAEQSAEKVEAAAQAVSLSTLEQEPDSQSLVPVVVQPAAKEIGAQLATPTITEQPETKVTAGQSSKEIVAQPAIAATVEHPAEKTPVEQLAVSSAAGQPAVSGIVEQSATKEVAEQRAATAAVEQRSETGEVSILLATNAAADQPVQPTIAGAVESAQPRVSTEVATVPSVQGIAVAQNPARTSLADITTQDIVVNAPSSLTEQVFAVPVQAAAKSQTVEEVAPTRVVESSRDKNLAAASGGAILANQTTLVGELGPEVFVEDSGSLTAKSATQGGTVLPSDLSTAHIIGAKGPEFIKPDMAGFVIPAEKFASQVQASTPQAPSVSTVVAATSVAAATSAQALVGMPSYEFGAPTAPAAPTLYETASGGLTGSASGLVGYQAGLSAGTQYQMADVSYDSGVSSTTPFNVLLYQSGSFGGITGISRAPGAGSIFALPGPSQPVFPQPPATQPGVPSNYPYYEVQNGVQVPIGVTETFESDPNDPGQTYIHENVAVWSGETLPQNTYLASGATTVGNGDVYYPPYNPTVFQDDYLSYQDLGATFASYQQQFSDITPGMIAPNTTGSPMPSLRAGVLTEQQNPAFAKKIQFPQQTDTSQIKVPTAHDQALEKALSQYGLEYPKTVSPDLQQALQADTARIGQSNVTIQLENIIKQELPMMDASSYEQLLTDRYLQRRQTGGSVVAGTPYLVGEAGPELMVPDSSGTIIPNNFIGGGTVVHNHNYFTIHSQTGKVDRASQSQLASRIASATQSGMRNK